jgi:D-xylose transport system substrate-binding protein
VSIKSGLVVVSLVLSVLIGIVIAHGNGPASAFGVRGKRAPVIGLSLDTLKEPRWQSDSTLFTHTVETLGGTVKVDDANGDDSRQMNDVQSLISQHVDVLVIVPHDGTAMARAVTLAHEAGIPVIAYDRLITNCDLDLYLSFDNLRVGRLQAQYLIDHLPTPGHGKIIRIYGSKTDHNAAMFKEGQDQAIDPYIKRGDIQVVWEDWAQDWRPEMAKAIVTAAITAKGRDFDAILASNDSTATGAIQALKEEGLAGKVMVTGQDADLIACQNIAQGLQTMTVYKPLKKLATRAAELAVAMAQGKPVVANSTVNNGKIDVPSVLMDVIAVDKSNLLETVVADGFHSKEEIYGNGH